MQIYESITAAKFLLALGYSKGKILTFTHVQKILYIAYVYFLANENRVILNEPPKAGVYGPVFITTRKLSFSNLISLKEKEFLEIKKDTKLVNFLTQNIGNKSCGELIELTTDKKTPWHIMKKKPNFKYGDEIDKELMSQKKK